MVALCRSQNRLIWAHCNLSYMAGIYMLICQSTKLFGVNPSAGHQP